MDPSSSLTRVGTTDASHSSSSHNTTHTSPDVTPAPTVLAPYSSVVAYRYNRYREVVERGVYFPPGSREFCAVRQHDQTRLPPENQKVKLINDPSGKREQPKLLLASQINVGQRDVIPLTPMLKAHELLQQWRSGVFRQSASTSALTRLPTETLLQIASLSTAVTLAKLRSMNRDLDAVMTPELDWRKCLIYGGTDIQFDEEGRMEVGENGAPERDYPPVLDASGRQIIDEDGDVVRRNLMVLHQVFRDADYFLQPLDQLPSVLDLNGQQVTDADGEIVRKNPVLNARYYTDALKEIHNLRGWHQVEALNVLTVSFNADPDTRLQPYLIHDQTQARIRDRTQVLFHPELRQLLTSSNPEAREWAIGRVIEISSAQSDLRWSAMTALLSLDAYSPQVEAGGVGKPSTTRITLQEAHKALFYSGNVGVRHLADSLIEDFQDEQIPQLTASKETLKTRNGIYRFPVRRSNGQVTEIPIPKHYDTWLGPRPIDKQRTNMEKLVRLMHKQHGSHGEAIAAGFAKYLLRNVTQWKADRIMALFDDSQDLGGSLAILDRLRSGRHTFKKILSGPGPNGYKIPEAVVRSLDDKMAVLNRTKWAIQNYVSYREAVNAPENYLHAHAFISQAIFHDLDLVGMAQSGNMESLREMLGPEYAPLRPVNDFFNWLAQNAHRTPQG
jgi:hypothetical protein